MSFVKPRLSSLTLTTQELPAELEDILSVQDHHIFVQVLLCLPFSLRSRCVLVLRFVAVVVGTERLSGG